MTGPARAGHDDADTRARVALALAVEPGDETVGGLVARLGAAAAVAALAEATATAAGRRLRTLAPDAVSDALAATNRLGARVVVPGDREWPSQLDDLGPASPFALWVLGAAGLRLLALRSVAVVGARASTSYGEAVARTLAADLAASGWIVVSGGAYGIDAAAHRGALAAGAPTVCLLASGVDVPYPRGHDALLARIADEGLVVSEAPPGAPAYRRRFLSRNRLIAALTRGTVVVEAALRSGSLNTARQAEALRRPVLGIPGPITSPMSAGVHALIREGRAVLASGADEVLELVGHVGATVPVDRRPAATPMDALAARERLVHDVLTRRLPQGVDAVVVATGLTVGDAIAALGVLEAAALARRVDGGWVATATAPPDREVGRTA